MKLAIVTPTYNEVGNIETLLTRIKKAGINNPDTHITVFVVDDSSPDGTAELVTNLAPHLKSKDFDVELFNRKEKDGLGRAYIFGFKKVLDDSRNFDYILQMDADLSHDPKYISGFIHQAEQGCDFVVACRYIPGGGTPDWPWYRKFMSKGGNMYTRALLGSRISDYTGGYNMYKSALLRDLDLDSIQSHGYGFLIDLKHRALNKAKTVAQIPIVFIDRKNGSSKIPKSTILKNFILVAKIWSKKQ